MADDFIQLPVDGPGKRVRSYTSTGAGGNTVHSQASTIVDQTGTGMGPFVAGRLDVHIGAAGVSLAVTSTQLPAALVSGRLDVNIGASTNIATTESRLPAALVSGRLDVNIGASSATLPISAVSLPLPTGAATNATLTDGTQKTKIVDAAGTNQATVSAAGAVKTDGSAVTQPVSDAGGSLTVDSPQLPAALVSGRVDVNIGASSATVPVSNTQLPAALVGGKLDVNLGTTTTNFGKTINTVAVNAAAGTTVINAAVVGQRHKVVGFLLTNSTGNNLTVQFNSGATALTGPLSLNASGQSPFAAIVIPVNPAMAFVQTATNAALQIVTTGGTVTGVIQYITEA
jgi:hypothetical protein